MYNEIIGIVVFDFNAFKQLRTLFKKSNDLNVRILYVNDFTKIDIDIEDFKVKNYKIYENSKVLEYVYKNLTGIDKVFCVVNQEEYKHYLSYELKKALEKVKPNIQVLGIDLYRMDLNLFEDSLKNAYSINFSLYKKYIIKRMIDKISGKIFSKIFSYQLNKKILLSYSSLNLFIHMYKNRENRFKRNRKSKLVKIDVLSENGYIFLENYSLYDIVASILKLYPSLEIKDVLEMIYELFYGTVNKKNDIKYFLTHLLYKEELNEFEELIKKDSILNIKENIIGNDLMDINKFFALHNTQLTKNFSEYKKFAFNVVLIYTLFFLVKKIPIVKEKVVYETDEFIFNASYLSKELVDELHNKFKIYQWQIDLVLNKHQKFKHLYIFNNSYNRLSLLLDDKDLLEKIHINIYSIDYYLHKMAQNGIIKIYNNSILFTKLADELFNMLEKTGLIDIYNSVDNVYNLIKKSDDLEKKNEVKDCLNKYLNIVSNVKKIYNLPSVNQIRKLKALSERQNIPKEAFKNRELASKIINDSIIDTEPSQKQKEYALYISKELGISIPSEILSSSKKLGNWIFEHKKNIKLKPTQKMIKKLQEIEKSYKIKFNDKIYNDFYLAKETIENFT